MKIRIKKLVNHPTALEYCYATTKGEVMALDSSLKAITYEKIKEGETPKKIKFDKNTPFVDIEVGNLEFNFLKYHSQVKHKGENPNLTNPIFELLNVGEEQNQKVTDIKKMKRVLNIVDSLNAKGIYNLCNYLQMVVTGMDISDIYIALLDPTKGIAYANYDKVVNLENDEDAELTIVVNKALAMNILHQRGSEYYYNEKLVAASLNELYYYFKNLPDLFEKGLKASVEEKEVELPITIQFSENFKEGRDLFQNKEKVNKNLEEITPEMIEWAKEKAKEMKIMVTGKMKPETIVEKVMEREKNVIEWAEMKKKREQMEEDQKPVKV